MRGRVAKSCRNKLSKRHNMVGWRPIGRPALPRYSGNPHAFIYPALSECIAEHCSGISRPMYRNHVDALEYDKYPDI